MSKEINNLALILYTNDLKRQIVKSYKLAIADNDINLILSIEDYAKTKLNLSRRQLEMRIGVR